MFVYIFEIDLYGALAAGQWNMRQWIALFSEFLGQIAGSLVFPHFRGTMEKGLGIHTAINYSGIG